LFAIPIANQPIIPVDHPFEENHLTTLKWKVKYGCNKGGGIDLTTAQFINILPPVRKSYTCRRTKPLL
jgi:hypothetical protein